MRIGLLSGEYPPQPGGVGAFTRVLARELAAQRHEVFVLAGPDAELSDDAVTVERCAGWSPASWSRVSQWVRAHGLQVVNLQYQTAAFGMSPFIHFLPQRMRSAPVVTTFHDLRFPYLFPKAGPLRPWIVRHLPKTSTGAIATNHEDFTALDSLPHRAFIPIGSNILAPAPDTGACAAARATAGASPASYIIAYFGLAHPSKGLDVLIDAAAQLLREGIPVRLLLIGGVGDDRSALDFALDAASMRQHTFISGFQPEAQVAALLCAADVVALPFRDGASFRRGSLMAALHYARPLISTTPAVPIPEFSDGGSMLLVPPDDAPALAQALRRLHRDPDLRASLSAGAAALAERFSWHNIARQTADFFREVVRA